MRNILGFIRDLSDVFTVNICSAKSSILEELSSESVFKLFNNYREKIVHISLFFKDCDQCENCKNCKSCGVPLSHQGRTYLE